MRTIKRYSNRKLYDTQEKKYITLENIESIIKDGEEVQIIDNDSGDDITAGTLSQIISEKTRKDQAYSPSIFVQMIRKGGGTMYDYAKKIMQTVGDTAYSFEEEIEKKIKGLIASGEITEEEGRKLALEMERQRAAYWDKLEKQLEAVTTMVLKKLNIPTKLELENLQNSLNRLENVVHQLEKRLEIPEAPPLEPEKEKVSEKTQEEEQTPE